MRKKVFVLFIGLILLIVCEASAVPTVDTIGNWIRTVDAADLISGAGSNLNSTYESTSGACRLSISGCTSNSDNWRIDVKEVTNIWDANFHFYIKRTSDGTGSGSISGGTSYQEVTTTYTAFFSGAGNRDSIYMQYQFTGISLANPVVSPYYSTTIYYSCIDI